MDSVLVQDEDDVGEGAQRDDKHHKEDLDVFDDLRDHADESTERLEQAHPVEELEPHEEKGDRSNDLKLVRMNTVGDLTIHVSSIESQRGNIDHVPNVEEVRNAIALDLNDFKDQESDKCLTEDNDAANLKNEWNAKLRALILCKVAGIGDERRKVADERNEELVEDSIEVALPHEVDKDSDLVLSKNLIVLSVGQNVGQTG